MYDGVERYGIGTLKKVLIPKINLPKSQNSFPAGLFFDDIHLFHLLINLLIHLGDRLFKFACRFWGIVVSIF